MKAPPPRAASDAILRTCSAFELVLFDRLPAAERALLGELRQDPDLYGILRPAAAGGTVKAVDRDTALLLFTLREAGPLPAYARQGEGAEQRLAEIAGLVMDGVLEIQDGEGFVSGAAALPLLSASPRAAAEGGALARLSRAALRYAEALELDAAEPLAMRLYDYHRLPLTPRWRRRLGGAAAVEELLGVAPGGARRVRLLADWTAAGGGAWLGWARRQDAGGSEFRFKLYLSPRIEALESAFEVLLEVLPAGRAGYFKIGADAAGLLRPDKLVIYFDDFDDLSRTATDLARELEGIPAHGVPFTAEVAGGGLLSWGLDPPGRGRLLPWQVKESWRLWVARRLAAGLVAARRRPPAGGSIGPPPAGVPPRRFARERLRLLGVDVERWSPAPELWRREAWH